MALGSYSKKIFGISAFQWCIDFFQFFKNYISELLGLPEWKKYICMQKFRVLPSKLSDLELIIGQTWPDFAWADLIYGQSKAWPDFVGADHFC